MDEVAALRREAMTQPTAAAAAEVKPEAAGAPLPDLKPVLYPAVAVIGRQVCERHRVSTLERDEVAALAEALANLADAYDFTVSDPKVAAWLGLVSAAGAIMMNRRPLPPPQPANEPAPEPAADAA